MITKSELDEIHASLGETHGGTPADYFGVAYLMREFSLSREQAVNQSAILANDFALGGFHVEPELKNFHLFSFQFSENPTCFQAPLRQLADSGLDRAFGEGPPGIAPDRFLARLKGALLSYQSVIERVFVHLVFQGDPAAAERSLAYARLREELENRKYLMDRFFGRPVTMIFQFRSSAGGDVGALAHQRTSNSYPLAVKDFVTVSGPAGEIMRVGFASLMDLHAMHREMGSRFFENNIRLFLLEGTPTNRSLERAFREMIMERKRDPLVMGFDHNGVTLYAEKVEEKNGMLVLTEPRLLNGAQTMATFSRFLAAHPDVPMERLDILSEMRVLCKIITDARSDFVLNVTVNNNRQNPVRPWNLHANDLIQLELQDKFREEVGIYYERQEKSFASLPEDEREELESREQTKAVEMVKLAQTFLAVDGEIERMSRLAEVFEQEDEYRLVFPPSRLKADPKLIVLCYKIQFRLSRLIREILERGETKYAPLRRARNLVWALLCQAILNDPDLAAHAASYGVKVGIEAGYTKLLASLASTRVRFLVSALLEDPRFAPKVAKENYGFLRTRAAYDACMDQAAKDWDWKPASLP